jgi:hypothetical protein
MSEDNTENQESRGEMSALTMAEFLETIPPNQEFSITDLAIVQQLEPVALHYVHTPEIQLHCPDEACNGTRFFRCVSETQRLQELFGSGRKSVYLSYRCSNCQRKGKIFSLSVARHKGSESGVAYKFGEYPPFGPPTPSRLVKLIGPDRELFLKGRRCENQGLGIGAFVYYRRVVEHQKARIFGEIIKVAKKLNTSDQTMAELEAARNETQFSKALSMVKEGIPQTLLINGHNPLLLLHGALSEGLHDRSDEECLELASSVRVVLAELAEHLAQALKDEAELDHALKTLLSTKDKKDS